VKLPWGHGGRTQAVRKYRRVAGGSGAIPSKTANATDRWRPGKRPRTAARQSAARLPAHWRARQRFGVRQSCAALAANCLRNCETPGWNPFTANCGGNVIDQRQQAPCRRCRRRRRSTWWCGWVGLGLAIVKTCVEACQGSVSARRSRSRRRAGAGRRRRAGEGGSAIGRDIGRHRP
jgi:hypothetical protein